MPIADPMTGLRGVPSLHAAVPQHPATAATRRHWAYAVFAGLTLLAPLPIAIFDGWVPLARIAMLATVTVAVAATEGAAGPVGMITGLLVAHAAVYTLLLAAVAVLIGLGLQRLPRRVAVALLVSALALAAGAAAVGRPYVTPFGHEPRANLFGVLS